MSDTADDRIVAAISTVCANPTLSIRKVALYLTLNREPLRRRLRYPRTRKENHVVERIDREALEKREKEK